MSVRPQLRQLLEQRALLSRAEARSLLELILDQQANEIEIAAILSALAARGETAAEVAGFVDAMRAAPTAVPLSEAERSMLVDTCGTGGDGAGTFNISTAASLVAAAAGAKVAKHGNRAVTSRSGSADVLEALGVPVDLSPQGAAAAIREHGFAYLHAPAMHPAMKAVMPVRRALGVRTIFNLVGPLTNPAGAQAQVMGVYAADRVSVVAEAMALLGTQRAFVVHGSTGKETGIGMGMGMGMDELSISGPSHIAEVRDGRVTHSTVTPEAVGLDYSPIEALRGGDASENAAILHGIFAGKRGPCRDVVVFNSAAVLVTANLADDLAAGVQLAQRTIDSGAVSRLLIALAQPIAAV
jgi:anthranilate phosphoribosyltransferase